MGLNYIFSVSNRIKRQKHLKVIATEKSQVLQTESLVKKDFY